MAFASALIMSSDWIFVCEMFSEERVSLPSTNFVKEVKSSAERKQLDNCNAVKFLFCSRTGNILFCSQGDWGRLKLTILNDSREV